MLELKGINKIYKPKVGDKIVALNNINLKFPSKGLIFLVGKSGSGKSTLLNILSGLDKATSGELLLNGKSFKSLKNSEIDAYRNTYLGFIFQEYNLIEEYNVYQNIVLAVELQKKKMELVRIDKLLSNVGLEGLGNRRVNELSGGQKQRIAIARALVKKPDIIVADEPTGNLDKETTIEIFDMLKRISKEKLVIVVSHDMDSARTFGDRVIEIENGSIIGDTLSEVKEEQEQELILVKSRLKLLSSLKMAILHIKNKKILMLFTILLITFSFVLFGFSTNLLNFDIPYSHAVAMKEEGLNTINLKKNQKNGKGKYSGGLSTFSTEDLKNMKLSNSNSNILYELFSEYDVARLEYDMISGRNDKYYYYTNSNFLYSTNLKGKKIIGDAPKTNKEVVFHKKVLEDIIRNGIFLESIIDPVTGEESRESYRPKTIEEILNDKKHIKMGNSYIIITGYIDEELSKYEKLKEIDYHDHKKNNYKIVDEFLYDLSNKFSTAYVNEEFITNPPILKTYYTSGTYYSLKFDIFGIKNTYFDVFYLNQEKEIFNGSDIVKVNDINKDELILGIYDLKLFDKKFKEGLEKTLEPYLEKSKKNLEEIRNAREKLRKLDELKIKNPHIDYSYEYSKIEVPELYFYNEQEITNNYAKEYIKNNNIIGSNVNLEIIDRHELTDKYIHKYNNLKIVGIDLDIYSSRIILNKAFLENFIPNTVTVKNVEFKSKDIKEIEEIFRKYPYKNAKITSSTKLSGTIQYIEKIVKSINKISKYVIIALVIFASILMTTFSLISINKNKKKIGTLRALGAKKIDIIKIFLLENLIIAIFASGLSLLGSYFFTNFANNLITKDLNIAIKPIIFSFDTFIYIGIVMILVFIISSFIPLYLMSKMRPVDAINQK